MSKRTSTDPLTHDEATAIAAKLRRRGYIELSGATIQSVALGRRMRPLTGSYVKAVVAAAGVLDVEPNFYGCLECTINHPPVDCPKLALDRGIAAGMEGTPARPEAVDTTRAEAIRMQAMQDVICRLDDLGDDSPPWLAPVIAANAAIVSVLDQLDALDTLELERTMYALREHLRPLTRTRHEATR